MRRDGSRTRCSVTHDEALSYAATAAAAFGVAANRDVPFDKDKAKEDVSGEDGKKSRSAKKAK